MRINGKTVTNTTPIIILHGLFGSSDNWQKIAKEFSRKHTVFCLDLRNHGDSEHAASMSFDEMAEDIIEFMNKLGIKSCILIGHSLGGKVAMALTAKHEDRVEKLIVVDILPKAYGDSHTPIIKAIRAVDMKVKSKNDVNAQLIDSIPELSVRQFIMKNVKRTEEGYAWKFNINAIEYNYPTLISALEFKNKIETHTIFIRGEKSDYITMPEYYPFREIFINSELISISGSGHWVHAEEPKAFVEVVKEFVD